MPDDQVFELTGGRVCLDLVNTVFGRKKQDRTDLLGSYADLVEFCRQAGLVNNGEAAELLRAAARRPEEAAEALERARRLREASYAVFLAAARRGSPAPAELEALNRELSGPVAASRLAPGESGYVWEYAGGAERLDRIVWPLARSAADLLTSPELSQVRQCASQTCAWLFLDHSRNASRRWCDMKICGNRDKVRRHRARARQS